MFFKNLKTLGYGKPAQNGKTRASADDFSMAVPFHYPVGPRSVQPPLAIICHLFHLDLIGWVQDALENVEVPATLYISTDAHEKKTVIESSFRNWRGGELHIRISENRGRDVAPKLVTFADVYSSHDLVLFIHSKKSPHVEFGTQWREYLRLCLLGSPQTVASILEIFDRHPDIGIIAPQHFKSIRARGWLHWGNNLAAAKALALKMNFAIDASHYMDFPSGSMFWARSAALRPLLDLELTFQDFPFEEGQLDLTIAHSIERLFFFTCETAGFTWVKIIDETFVEPADAVCRIGQATDIDYFIQNHRFDLLNIVKDRV